MRNGLAFAQLALGVLGVVLCGFLYLQFAKPMQAALGRLDEMTGDAKIQAEIGSELLDEWSLIGGDLQRATDVHQQSLAALQRTSRRLADSIEQWETSLRESSQVSLNASRMAREFAGYLPLKIPDIALDQREIQFEIPEFHFKQEQVRLPYPRVAVGSATKEIDLGVTSFKLDVPTLSVQTRDRIVSVPASPEVTQTPYRFSVPDNLRVSYRELLGDEKELLVDTADQLEHASAAMVASAGTLQDVRSVMTQALPDSIRAGQSNLANASQALEKLRMDQIPEFQARLFDQREQLSRTQAEFASLQDLIPWLFALVALLPLAICLHALRLCVPSRS